MQRTIAMLLGLLQLSSACLTCVKVAQLAINVPILDLDSSDNSTCITQCLNATVVTLKDKDKCMSEILGSTVRKCVFKCQSNFTEKELERFLKQLNTGTIQEAIKHPETGVRRTKRDTSAVAKAEKCARNCVKSLDYFTVVELFAYSKCSPGSLDIARNCLLGCYEPLQMSGVIKRKHFVPKCPACSKACKPYLDVTSKLELNGTKACAAKIHICVNKCFPSDLIQTHLLARNCIIKWQMPGGLQAAKKADIATKKRSKCVDKCLPPKLTRLNAEFFFCSVKKVTEYHHCLNECTVPKVPNKKLAVMQPAQGYLTGVTISSTTAVSSVASNNTPAVNNATEEALVQNANVSLTNNLTTNKETNVSQNFTVADVSTKLTINNENSTGETSNSNEFTKGNDTFGNETIDEQSLIGELEAAQNESSILLKATQDTANTQANLSAIVNETISEIEADDNTTASTIKFREFSNSNATSDSEIAKVSSNDEFINLLNNITDNDTLEIPSAFNESSISENDTSDVNTTNESFIDRFLSIFSPNQDCKLSDFGNWTTCSVSCGNGTQSRNRHVLAPTKGNGSTCDSLNEHRTCNLGSCDIDCQLSDFGNWSDCSVTCDGGLQKRFREVITPPSGLGKKCEDIEETQSCNSQECDRDCQLSEFGNWSVCDKECGGGKQYKVRQILQQPKGNGTQCDNTTEEQYCNTQECDRDCQMDSWNSWESCSQTCGGGIQSRYRAISITPIGTGAKCDPMEEQKPCNTLDCDRDCELGEFGNWTECDRTCDGGKRYRHRNISVEPLANGKKCDPLDEFESCNEEPCDRDCKLSEFGNWTDCSASCDGGNQTRYRSVLIKPLGNGTQCDSLEAIQSCNTHECDRDCVLTEFGNWTDCSATCDEGTMTRYREIKLTSKGNGTKCESLEETVRCLSEPCDVDCIVDDFGSWTDCSATCDGGNQTRDRQVIIPRRGKGLLCPELEQIQVCNTHECDRNCQLTEFGNWTDCSASCDGGNQTRYREIKLKAKGNGLQCDSLEETQTCNTHDCDVDCQLSDYGNWSDCSASCGDGNQTRYREIKVQPKANGSKCESLEEIQICNVKPCDRDCVVSEFGNWTDCSASCDGGNQARFRSILITPIGNGSQCESLEETEICNTHECDRDCLMSAYGNWSVCDKECGGGKRSKVRQILAQPKGNGTQCGNTTEEQECNIHECDRDCELSPFGNWTECNATCDGGYQQRSRKIWATRMGSGKLCEPLEEVRSCNTHDCDRNCSLSSWLSWSNCSATCNGGNRTRQREIIQESKGAGLECGNLTEIEDCSTQPCDVDCKVTEWSQWSPCSVTCGFGESVTNRQIIAETVGKGKKCPMLNMANPCHQPPCGTAIQPNETQNVESLTGSVESDGLSLNETSQSQEIITEDDTAPTAPEGEYDDHISNMLDGVDGGGNVEIP